MPGHNAKTHSLHSASSQKKGPSKNLRVIGFCLGLFGLFYALFCDVIFHTLVERALTLRPNSKIFEVWKTPPLKLTLDVYFFNWTNPEQFGNHSIKPILQEIGPYRFIEVPTKVDIDWHPEDSTVSYRKQSFFHFEPEGSVGTLEDKITTLNTLAVTLARKTRHWDSIRTTVIDLATKIYRDKMEIKKTVDELLFTGYEDVLLTLANNIPESITEIAVPFKKFGYTYPRNGSADVSGVFTVHTGADNIQKLGRLNTWNHRVHTKYYPQECSKVYGSTGEFQGPYLQQGEPIDYFLADFCRPLTLDYVEATRKEDLDAYKYVAGPRAVDNGTLDEQNRCYCNGECVPSGLINISSCWYGAPIFISYPHFYQADPYYRSQVEGLNADKDKHEFYVVLEQKTGLAMELSARFQVNVLVEPMNHLTMFRNQRRIFFPLFWFEERTFLNSDIIAELKIVPMLIFSGRIFGVLCVLMGMVLFYYQRVASHYRGRVRSKMYALGKGNNLCNGHAPVSKISSIIVTGAEPAQKCDTDSAYLTRL